MTRFVSPPVDNDEFMYRLINVIINNLFNGRFVGLLLANIKNVIIDGKRKTPSKGC